MASEVYNLYIRILTPVHVGVDKSRDLTAGLDYKVDNGILKIYDHKKLVEMVGNINDYCNALEKGKNGVNNLLKNRRININDIQAKEYGISGNPKELKRQICNGMDGKPILPGSSIKGALTSVLFSKLRNHENNPNAVLGNFQSSLNRFIHCTDVSFDQMAAYNAKIFNLTGRNGNFQGGWKHEFRNNTSQRFDPEGFTFAFETIKPDFSAPFTLSFDKNMYQKYISQANRNDRLRNLPQSAQGFQNVDNFHEKLFSILHAHTEAYLDRELEFLTHFNHADHSGKLLASINHLQNINTQEAPVFRLASGSGFHSITGDWQFNTHNINGINHQRRNRGQHDGKDSAKSRRFAFEYVNSDWLFYPMGFVQVMSKEYYENNFKEKEEELKQAEIEKIRKIEAEKQKEIEERKAKEEEARKPQFIQTGPFNHKKRYEFEAIVTKSGRPNLISVYIIEGVIQENVRLDVYRSPLDLEKVIIVECGLTKKGLINQASFKGFKNTTN